jgi:hypothetical protein
LPAAGLPASARESEPVQVPVPGREPVKVQVSAQARALVSASAQVQALEPERDLARAAVSSWETEAVNRWAAAPPLLARSHRCRGRNR